MRSNLGSIDVLARTLTTYLAMRRVRLKTGTNIFDEVIGSQRERIVALFAELIFSEGVQCG